MTTVGFYLTIGFSVYWTGVGIWLARSAYLTKNRFFNPWKRTLDRVHTNAEHEFYVSRSMEMSHLLDWQVVLSPVAWVRYWNWRPK